MKSLPRDQSFWDYHSDQPYRLAGRDKGRWSPGNLREYLATALTTLENSPRLLWRYLNIAQFAPRPLREFVGLGISYDPDNLDAMLAMVEDLGVKRLLLRVPVWQLDYLDQFVQFARQFSGRHILINILQQRESVLRPESWRDQVHRVLDAFAGVSDSFQLGNAVNRSKWGCRHGGEYLAMLEQTDQLRLAFPGVKLLHAGVIDFEPLPLIRGLINDRGFQLHGCGAQLYVNRRGSPYERQFGLFDLAAKLRLFKAILSLSCRCEDRLWITEFNWPLLHTKPYTPNSGRPETTVDEQTQARYLRQYIQIARASGMVEKVYWWQLIAPGYGLVDCRGGTLRKRPAYDALRQMLKEGEE